MSDMLYIVFLNLSTHKICKQDNLQKKHEFKLKDSWFYLCLDLFVNKRDAFESMKWLLLINDKHGLLPCMF